MKRLVRFVFFGNVFYGICAVALSVEGSLQQGLHLNDILFYILVFLVAILYYNIAYITEKPSASLNLRARWYARNLRLIKNFHLFLKLVFVACIVLFLRYHWTSLLHMPIIIWLIILVFPFTAALYYGVNHKSVGRFNLRDIGWLKPFIIGFSWAGLVTVFPAVYYFLSGGVAFHLTLIGLLLFVKNFMFISLLCILFDIKDYATDYNQHLKTVVVKIGLRKTIFYIIIPLTIIGLGSFLAYGFTHSFSPLKIMLNTIPFLLLITVAYSLQRRRSIFYYLVIIDGLMLLKALCGITAMLFF